MHTHRNQPFPRVPRFDALVWLLLLPLLLGGELHAADWIVNDGRARAEIVISAKPARAAELGAAELQKYVEKITGSRLDIVTAPTGTMPVQITSARARLPLLTPNPWSSKTVSSAPMARLRVLVNKAGDP